MACQVRRQRSCAISAAVGKDLERVDAVVLEGPPAALFERRDKAAGNVPRGQSLDRRIEVAVKKDFEVEQGLDLPIAHQHVDPFDEDQRRRWSDTNGAGTRVLLRVIELGKQCRSGAVECLDIGPKRCRVECVQSAAATQILAPSRLRGR